ncbi:hypothetical protein FRC11_006886 [Ceratobasidium sp. 423]|nr:hypothetical protein FRC11_006886 [Ceratobasidium sp. 423]
MSKGSKWLYGDEFRFTDTPGFGNEIMEDTRILELLVESFAPNPRGDRQEGSNLPRRITGVLYIHSEEEQFKNRVSRKTIEMLVKVLGTRFLDRVTILIRSQQKPKGDLSNYMPPEDSPLYPLYCNDIKPWTMAYEQDIQSIVNILEPYIDVHPRLIRFAVLENFAQRDGNNWQHEEIPRHLKKFFLADVGLPAIAESPHQEQEKELERLRILLAQKDGEIEELQSVHDNELKAAREKMEVQKVNHDLDLKSLCDTIRDHEEQMSKLKSRKDSEPKKLETPKNVHEEIKRLRNLLAQKEKEIIDLRSTHDIAMKNIQEERMDDKFSHDAGLKRLYTTIQDQEVELLKLKSSRDLELEKLEKLNEEISKLSLDKGAEIKELRDLLAQKEREIGHLRSSHGSRLKNIQSFAHEIELNFKSLWETIQDQESMDAVDPETKEIETMQLKTKVNNTITETENNQGGRIHRLNAEARQTSAEYGSPHYDIRLQEEAEQGGIMTTLGDINRLIEEFGQSLSEHMERHMAGDSSKKAFRPQDLLGLFGRVGSGLASKVKQDVYLLFEYAVQATICDQLYTHLFRPFHPSIADDEKRNTFIMEIYDQMIHQESQSVAGRWRRDTFRSMSKSPALSDQGKPDDERMHRLITEALSTLLRKLIEVQPHGFLKEHSKALIKVITKAEEFNRLLKGEVSILGDFQPIAFSFGEAFQPSYMSGVNPKPKKAKQPETILATVELGLIKRYALGGNRMPEETVIRKAVVFGLPK